MQHTTDMTTVQVYSMAAAGPLNRKARHSSSCSSHDAGREFGAPPAAAAATAGCIAAGAGTYVMPCAAAMCGGIGPMAVGIICSKQDTHTYTRWVCVSNTTTCQPEAGSLYTVRSDQVAAAQQLGRIVSRGVQVRCSRGCTSTAGSLQHVCDNQPNKRDQLSDTNCTCWYAMG